MIMTKKQHYIKETVQSKMNNIVFQSLQ